MQLDFIWFELTTFPGYGLAKLKASSDVTEAVVAFQDKFEGCGQCDQGNRVTYAKAVLNAYGSEPAPAYAATFVSQTYPYASVGPVKVVSGETVKGHIVMKNTGTATWTKGKTMFAPIPRDKASPFHAASWASTTRVSTVTGDVAPGKEGTFEWDLEGGKPGDYSPFFGFVEEGVTWFADAPKGGGPEDSVVQVHVVVEAAPATGGGGSGGSGAAGKAGAAGKSGAAGKAGGSGGSGQAGGGGAEAAGAGGDPGGDSGSGGDSGLGGDAGSGDDAGAAGDAGQGGAGSAGGATETGGTEASAGAAGTAPSAGGSGGVVEVQSDAGSSGGCAIVVLPRGGSALGGLGAFAALAASARRRWRR